MRPLEIADAPQISPEMEGLYLLNDAKVDPHYFEQLLNRKGTVIRSKAGSSLPNELWAAILEFAYTGEDSFRLAMIETVSASPEALVLRCFKYDFVDSEEEVQSLAGRLPNRDWVLAFEDYLTRAKPEKKLVEFKGFHEYLLSRDPDPKNNYEVVLDTTTKNQCIYTCLTVPDVIAKIDDDWCCFCNRRRFICPGCTGGQIQKYGDLFMGCGVDLACPLCMGLDFSEYHKDVLEKHYYYLTRRACLGEKEPYELTDAGGSGRSNEVFGL
ncbi:hypothetical protein F5Y02DRAFT_322575 [Annulohypoxylon stygium]|nr:hypothetical protein F5Y02DRAFT_322575 [Annulohypoxylon stygium]